MGDVVFFSGGRRCRICSEQLDAARAAQLEVVEAWYARRPGLLDVERGFRGAENTLDKAAQCRRCQEAAEPSMVRQLGRLNAKRRGYGCWNYPIYLPD